MYYELINRLSDSYKDYKHVLLEGKSINEKFEDIPKDLLDKTNVSIQNTLDLSELIEYLSKSRLCVSPDTGVRNVAIATHTPTVGIFYSTVPYRYSQDMKMDMMLFLSETEKYQVLKWWKKLL